MAGAMVSVEPVTATSPVLPDNVHSGATSDSGATVGHPEGAAVVVIPAAVDSELAESASEPHAASISVEDTMRAGSKRL